ncbi:hypothetical protein G6F61_002275 [Rhizopus arrhizus]|nr:hypothetical protein G6F61_002275 [Rhizopus arrhizus]
MFIRLSLVLSAVSMLVSIADASGQIAQIVDATDFCVFLPPTGETDRIIADSEWEANAFCMGNTPLAIGAEKLPSGFIQSAHYVKTDNYVQITGQMDPTKANLNSSDDGGQYDIKAPKGASCAGWDYFVNLIEPSGKDYCIRCCNNDQDCNRGISEKGCAYIIPGDYSGPSDESGSSVSLPSSSVTASVTTATTSTTIQTLSATNGLTTSSIDSPSSTTNSNSFASSSIVKSSSIIAQTTQPLNPVISSSVQTNPSAPSAQESC